MVRHMLRQYQNPDSSDEWQGSDAFRPPRAYVHKQLEKILIGFRQMTERWQAIEGLEGVIAEISTLLSILA